MKLAGVHRLFMSGAPAASAGAAPSSDGGGGGSGDAPATSRINFLEGQEVDQGLTEGPLQQMYVPKSGADKALPKLSFANLGPQTGGPRKKK